MRTPTLLVSLNTEKNDYQRQQAVAAQEAGRRWNAQVIVVHAENGPAQQDRQLLHAIRSDEKHIDGIVVMPVGSEFAHIATAAARAGVGLAVLNREVDYLGQLRTRYKVPMFSVTIDQEEAGRIQARQMGALLPNGGSAIYILGPEGNTAVIRRAAGMQEALPQDVQITTLRGKWTEQSGFDATSSWLKSQDAQRSEIALVAAQSDNMALGARRAFEALTEGAERERYLRIPFLGIDAAGATPEWLRRGLLRASVALPTTTDLAVEIFVRALHSGTQPPEQNSAARPISCPSLETLGSSEAPKFAAIAPAE